MTVSQQLPSGLSDAPPTWSFFLVSLIIFPDGVCTASFAGFMLPEALDELDDAFDGWE
jgi:hypothetical protein